jgi:transcriptional regulator with XRE-family HTH domain
MGNINEKPAENLRQIRKEKELSQERLSEMADKHRTYVSMIENRGDNPSLQGLEDLAEGKRRRKSELVSGGFIVRSRGLS